MNIKMIVTDLDGTLLRDDKTVSERTMTAISRCREKGIKAVYATGRGSSSAKLFSPDTFDGYVRNNGALTYIDDVLIHSKLMPIESVRDLLVACDSAGIKIAAEHSGTHYSNFGRSEKHPWLTQYELVDFSTHDVDVEKIYAIADTPKVAEFMRQYLTDDLYMFESHDWFAMVMHKEATKSKALSYLTKHWNIDRSQIVAFGDDMNDIDLLKYSGIGVATGNAIDEVKAVADQICDTNENDGIAKWLEEHLL